MTTDTELDIEINIDVSLANAIRRTIISGLKTTVIDSVIIKENDSVLSDEMVAHRIGLIPLSGNGSGHVVTLNEIGPKTVYSRDIQFPENIKAVSPDIIILNLGPNEKINLIGYTEEGTAFEQEHSKYSVSCGTSYKKLSDNLFQMHIETTGSISAKDAFISSIQTIKEELIKYKKIL